VSLDISTLLQEWKFEPDKMQVRLIPGDDGLGKLQIRLDLGVLQMELDGRPDGTRPHGEESYLDYFEAQESQDKASSTLDSEQLTDLMREGVQFYNRYMALFVLEDYDRVARDTARNLRLFQFVVSHVKNHGDRWAFEQYTPFVTMMHGRALGQKALKDGSPRDALRVIDAAIEAVVDFIRAQNENLREDEEETDESDSPELSFLRTWRTEIEQETATTSPLDLLEEQLKLAVGREDYEDAARIRDELRKLQVPTSESAGENRSSSRSTDPADQLDQPGGEP